MQNENRALGFFFSDEGRREGKGREGKGLRGETLSEGRKRGDRCTLEMGRKVRVR